MTSLGPYPGIAWAITTALPERAFMADAESLQTRAIVLSVGAVLLAGGLAFWLSRTLSRPLLRLSEHVAKVGGGDFDARLHLDDAAELRTVSDAINRMAGGLRQRLELEQSLQVAMHVQQSLLPNEPPHIRGLDIAGQSKYCDATGGDYFDFLQVSPLDDGVAMIAIGDVMGHGVGAALLMATARAAVHASVVGGRPLAEIMGDVNRVLSRDARHGLFMTMLLALVDTRTRCVRWCSAGHDPIICYDPSADSFFELEGGDIPLGIIEDQPYTMHAKTMLHAGTVLLAGTDGVWEARNEAGELYGKDRLKQLIRTHARSPSMAIASELELDLRRYVGPRPMHDDVTFIVVRVTG
jgi:sigma-B regulation protein RsbU (phosphoserine phosphatase)